MLYLYITIYFSIEINTQADEDQNEDHDNDDEDEENAVPEYKQLIAIHAGKPKGELGSWLDDTSSHYKIRRLSLSEQELESAIRNHGTDIIR